MAALDGFNKTSQNDLIEGVQIDAVILEMNDQPVVYSEIAWLNMKVTKPTWRIVRDDLITVNATLAESDEAALTSFTTSSVDITPGTYPVVSHVGLELTQDASIDVLTKSIGNHGRVIRSAMDANLLGSISSATNTSDHNGTGLDKAKFEAALLAFKKQKPNAGPIIFVGGFKQIADIIGAYGDSSGSVYAVPGVASDAVGAKQDSSQFYRRTVQGIGLYEAAVPASGGADVSGAFMVQRRALALGFWEILNFRLLPVSRRTGQELMTYSRYGCGIASQANLREVISLA